MRRRRDRLPPTGTFGVLFDLDRKSNSFFVGLSKDILKNFKTEFVFDGVRYHPHITLYLFSAPVRNVKKIIEKTGFLSNGIKPAKLRIGKLISSHDGWVMGELVGIEEIRKYQELVIKILNPLRENMQRSKYRNSKFVKSLPENERVNLQKYGNRFVFDLYHPHVSLAKVNNAKEAKEIIDEYKKKMVGKEIRTSSLSLLRDIGGKKGRSVVLYKKDLN